MSVGEIGAWWNSPAEALDAVKERYNKITMKKTSIKDDEDGQKQIGAHHKPHEVSFEAAGKHVHFEADK
jgi:hypothetical protein